MKIVRIKQVVIKKGADHVSAQKVYKKGGQLLTSIIRLLYFKTVTGGLKWSNVL